AAIDEISCNNHSMRPLRQTANKGDGSTQTGSRVNNVLTSRVCITDVRVAKLYQISGHTRIRTGLGFNSVAHCTKSDERCASNFFTAPAQLDGLTYEAL